MLSTITQKGSNGNALATWTMAYYDNGNGYDSAHNWNMGDDKIKSDKFFTHNEASALGATSAFGGGFHIQLNFFLFFIEFDQLPKYKT